MKNTKKGFTLVELLVVIAIVAILATVAIIGYTSFINKAEESNDRTFVAQLNTVITRVDGKYETFHEVVEVLEKEGFTASDIDAIAEKQEILWNMDTQKFFYSADDNTAGENVWVVSKTVGTQYSTYYIGDNGATLNATLGFDAGDATDLTVEYVGIGTAQTVVLRTNGGVLTVDAALDNVHHYGYSDKVYIKNVAPSSYYENGVVEGFISLQNGHLVLNTANEYVVMIDATAENITNGSIFVNITAPNTSNVQLYADSDVIDAIVDKAESSGKEAFKGIETEGAKAKDDLVIINTVAELEEIIAKVNDGTLVNPMVYLAEGKYQFTKTLTINKSISIIGVSGKTVLLGYDNTNSKAKFGQAFTLNIEDENQVITFSGLDFDSFGLYKNRGTGELIASNIAAYSGIYADNAESTVVNVSNCSFVGMAHNFINAKGGTYNVTGCRFDATDNSYDYANVTQFGDYTGERKTTVNISDSTFIGGGSTKDSDAEFTSTLISPWCDTDLTVNNSHFENAYEAISGGSEYYDYTGEFNCSGSTFANVYTEIRIARFVGELSEIPGDISEYSVVDSSYSDKAYLDVYTKITTNGDGNSVLNIYYYDTRK